MNTALAWRLGMPALVAVAVTWLDVPQLVRESDAIDLRLPEYTVRANSGTVALGRKLFEDPNLSLNQNQSCQTCHDPTQAFAAPGSDAVTRGSVAQGSVAGKFGRRKPPSVAYAALVPIYSAQHATGGNFWDGRATGLILGSPAADHALRSFLDPSEQALPDAACVILRVREGAYVDSYTSVWGNDILSIDFPAGAATVCATPADRAGTHVRLSKEDRVKVDVAFEHIALSIMAFESSAVVSKFSSRFDERNLTLAQQRGAKLFNGKAKCSQCHPSNVLLSDARYHNVGVPRNPDNPVFNYATTDFDPGLGGITGLSTDFGKFRTPTVRNVAAGKHRTFMHNGALKSLKQVVDFYNTRDVLPVCSAHQIETLEPVEYGSFDPDGAGPLTAGRCWPPAESPQNVNTLQLGDLRLTEPEVDAIVAFLKALQDL